MSSVTLSQALPADRCIYFPAVQRKGNVGKKSCERLCDHSRPLVSPIGCPPGRTPSFPGASSTAQVRQQRSERQWP